MTLVSRLNAVLDSMPPAVAGASAEAWVNARLDQVRAVFSAERALEPTFYVLASSPLFQRLAVSGALARLRYSGVVVEDLDASFARLDNLGDDSFMLEVLTNRNSLNSSLHRSLGLAPASPMTPAELETRWILQLTDKVEASEADRLARSF